MAAIRPTLNFIMKIFTILGLSSWKLVISTVFRSRILMIGFSLMSNVFRIYLRFQIPKKNASFLQLRVVALWLHSICKETSNVYTASQHSFTKVYTFVEECRSCGQAVIVQKTCQLHVIFGIAQVIFLEEKRRLKRRLFFSQDDLGKSKVILESNLTLL